MLVKVQSTKNVRPAAATPHHRLWCTNLDLVAPKKYARFIYFYKSNDSSDFFDSTAMEESLSRTLVAFYPLAGRMGRDSSGRMEVVCNGEGALFIEAVCETTAVDDLGDFAPTSDFMKLFPEVIDVGVELASAPLVLLQLTRFKCKGISLSATISHQLVDGSTAFNFISSWAAATRGLAITVPPVFDRSFLRARTPPKPTFPHTEYPPPPSSSPPPVETIAKMFNLTPSHLKALRSKLPKNTSFSTTTVVASHVWKCMCIALGLSNNQTTRMFIATNGRPRFSPPLPLGYFGNAIFLSVPTALAGDVVNCELRTVAAKVDQALKRMDDEYLRSAIDYLELQRDASVLARGAHTFKSPNMGLTSWLQLPVKAADFGWGGAAGIVPVAFWFEGLAFLLPSMKRDGGVAVLIALRHEFMARLEKVIYEFLQAKL